MQKQTLMFDVTYTQAVAHQSANSNINFILLYVLLQKQKSWTVCSKCCFIYNPQYYTVANNGIKYLPTSSVHSYRWTLALTRLDTVLQYSQWLLSSSSHNTHIFLNRHLLLYDVYLTLAERVCIAPLNHTQKHIGWLITSYTS